MNIWLFRQVYPTNIFHPIKLVLSESGIDLAFTAYSTRGGAVSSAPSKGILVDSILRTGSWASESTFTRSNGRDLPSFALPGAVFNRQHVSQQ